MNARARFESLVRGSAALRVGILAIIIGIVAVSISQVLAFHLEALLLHIGVSTMELGAAIVIVNVVLHRRAQGEAAGALTLSSQSALKFTDAFRVLAEQSISRVEFERILREYDASLLDSHNDPRRQPQDALKQSDCGLIAGVYNNNHTDLSEILRVLGEDLKELTSILGWGFDPEVLRYCIRARHSIRELTLSSDDRTACVALLDAYRSIDELVRRLAALTASSGTPKRHDR